MAAHDAAGDFTRKVKPMVIASLILQLGAGTRATIPGLVAQASPFSKGVLLLLLLMSVYSWAVIWNRLRLYGRVARADVAFVSAFRRLPDQADFRIVAEQNPASILGRAALAGQRSLEQHPQDHVGVAARFELAQRAMDRAANDEVATLERHVGFLATTGNVAPFIGLMGTVWGVMAAFVNIGAQGSASLIVVAPGIAEALIATIAGLAAAIPAVIGYNHCLGRVREFGNNAGSFTSEFLDRRIGAHL
jgi:biopolymer transport protein TolQ